MNWNCIACIEDIVRPRELLGGFPLPLFTLISEPIRQATGQNILFEADAGIPAALQQFGGQAFSRSEFEALLASEGEKTWEQFNFEIPAAARDYLYRCIPLGTLLLGVEIADWLKSWCKEANIDYLDLRISPLRFARDFYVAINTNNKAIYERLRPTGILREEVALEATAMSASALKHQWELDRRNIYPLDLDDTLIYIGQTSVDAAIIGEAGKHLRCQDFSSKLQEIASRPWRRVMYKPHPCDNGFANEEKKILEDILHRPISLCHNNGYQLLASAAKVELISISSGLLQEAEFFAKPAHWLHKPLVPLAWANEPYSAGCYLQIHFEDILAPSLWHKMLAPDAPAPLIPRLPDVVPNYGRELLDAWWDYSKFKLWQRSLWTESFERSGGAVLRQRVEMLEQGLLRNRNMVMDCDEKNHVELHNEASVKGRITIRGRNNEVVMKDGVSFDGTIDITGDNNRVYLDQHVRFAGKIYITGNGGELTIGRKTTVARAVIKCHEGKKISIGFDCMFSYGIELRTSDAHSIVNPATGKRTNPPEDIIIGNHVWAGKDVTFLKGARIANDTIIGANSLVSRAYDQSQTVLAGTPAKIINQSLTWQREAKAEFSPEELQLWQSLGHPSDERLEVTLESSGIQPVDNSDWVRCLKEVQEKIGKYPQEFGRGELYQGHEAWGVKGQRPTLQRIRSYGFEEWIPANANILDIGCNTGMFGLALSENIKSYYGFDYNPVLIDIARQFASVRNIENCRFECESFLDFMKSNGECQFDVIFSFAVHVWIGMPIEDYAKTIFNLLRPGGIVVWESNRLDTNDKDFFQNVLHFINAGFSIQSSGKLKDDEIIERGFYILVKTGTK
jgi:acetyltransferase-like isoleucine patch superfamily enzyme/SAM-dependent methyltransferase